MKNLISVKNYSNENLETYKKALEIYKEKEQEIKFLHKKIDDHNIKVLENLSQKIRSQLDVFIIIGVGGSNGASRAVIEGLGSSDIQIEYAGNSLSPKHIRRILNIVKEKDVSINVIAKNFKTLEPGLHFRMIREEMAKKYSKRQLEDRIIVTGTKNTLLEKIAIDNNYKFLEFDEEIGGRFSAFTNVHLLPIAVAGIDIRKYLSKRDEFLSSKENIENILKYVSYRYDNFKKGKVVEILSSTDPYLSYFNKWWVQLFGESQGKDNLGIYPDSMVFSEDLHSMGQFIQSGNPIFMETFLRIKEYEDVKVYKSKIFDEFEYLDDKTFSKINKAMEEASIKAHLERDIPIFDIQIDRLCVESFSELFSFFIVAVIISSYLMGLSPFGQEGVEKYKSAMNKNLRSN